MTTYSHLTGDLFGEALTSSPADSPVSHSVPPESERDETMSDISFRKCFEWWQRYGRVGSSLRTFAGCLVSNLDEYSPRWSHRWKAKGTRSSRFVFLLVPSVPRTGGIGSGSLLGTPTVDNWHGHRRTDLREGRQPTSRIETGRTTDYLNRQIAMLPTPTTQEIEHSDAELTPSGRRLASNGETHSLNLADTVQMLPTPRANGQEGYETRAARKGHDSAMSYLEANIEYAGKMLPTPKEQNSRANGERHGTGGVGLDVVINGNEAGSTLRLQPAMCEWMMGYPLNWTSLEQEITEWPD